MDNSKSKYEDQMLMKRLEDLISSSIKKIAASYTDFLNPRQQIMVTEYFKNFRDAAFAFYGGYEEAERKICCIYNEDIEYSIADYPIDILHLSWKSHKTINHRDILGSLLGTGIRREKIGDIIQYDDEAFVCVHRDIAGYLLMNISKIGSVCTEVERYDCIPEFAREEKTISAVIASLRLDCILAAGFGVSRAKAAEAVKSSRVFVNWKPEVSSSKEIKAGDVISWRGKGRIKLDYVAGVTKKDRTKVNIIKYI